MPKLYTSREAAAFIAQRTGKSMTDSAVRKEIEKGHIAAFKAGHVWFIKEEVLDEYNRRNPGKTPAPKGLNAREQQQGKGT